MINLRDGVFVMLCICKLLSCSIELLNNSDAEDHEIDLQVIGSDVERISENLNEVN